MEVHVRTRRDLKPDPDIDPICAIMYCIWQDLKRGSSVDREVSGMLVADQEGQDLKHLDHCGLPGLHIDYYLNEKELLSGLVQLLRRLRYLHAH